MHILRLYLIPNVALARLPWALLDAGGQMVASGDEGEPWPVADQTEWILAAGCTLFTLVNLPAKLQANKGALLGFALEPELANEPSDNLYLQGDKLDDGRQCVALTAVAPLTELRALLNTQGMTVERIVPEEMLLPTPEPGAGCVAQLASGWMLRLARTQALFLPLAAEPMAASICVDQLTVCGPARLPSAWRQTPHALACEYDWRRAPLCLDLNFACGVMAAQHAGRQWRGLLRRLSLVLLWCCTAELLLSATELGWLSWQQFSLSREVTRMSAAFGVAAPNPGQALPQAFAGLEQQRQMRGLTQRAGALELMSALAQVAGDSLRLQALDFRDGRLRFSHVALSDETLRRWRGEFLARQLLLEPDGVGQWRLHRAPSNGEAGMRAQQN